MKQNVVTKTVDTPLAISYKGLVTVLASHFGLSVTEMKRLFVDGAVHRRLSHEAWEKMEVNMPVLLDGSTIRVGKHRFAKLPLRTKPLTIEMWEE